MIRMFPAIRRREIGCGWDFMKALIFDFDYTLGDTTEGILDCLSCGLRELGFPPAGREEMRRTIGLSLPASLRELTGCGDEDMGREFSRVFMARADQVMVASAALYEGTAPLLLELKDRGIGTAIVTTKAAFRVRGILEKFGLSGLVDVIVGSDMVKKEKPDPEALELALTLLHIGPEEAIYIGDSAVDAQCARSAGVAFAGVTTGTTPAETLAEYPHILVARDLSELRERILL